MSMQKVKQPKALLPLCATEAWERFGFYMIQAALVLMLTNHFHFPDDKALLTTGTFGALIYIAPTIGGYFADKILGFRYTILIGCILQMFGYICVATLSLLTVFLGLALIILGNGFLKANIPSFLGTFYSDEDDRRRSGFTYYYMGMNTGSFIGILIVGYVQNAWGWHICYIIAAIGMFVGIIIYLANFKRFTGKGMPVNRTLVYEKTGKFVLFTLLVCAIIIAVCYILLSHAGYGDFTLSLFAVLVLCFLLHLCLFKYKGKQSKNLFALIILTVFAVVFWAIYFQMFSLVPLFIERTADHQVFGFDIPTSSFLSLEPVFILVLGWPLAILWTRLHHAKKDPNILIKFILALLCLSLAMKLLAYSTHHTNTDHLIYPIVILVFFLLLTIGEMLLSPNFLAAVTELAPPGIIGMMMGIQYMAIAFGSLFSGILGQLAVIPPGLKKLSDIESTYAHAFNVNALICLVCAGIILALLPFIARLMNSHGKSHRYFN